MDADNFAAGIDGGVSRRAFLKAGAAAAGGLTIGFVLPSMPALADVVPPQDFAPNAFIRINRQGKVKLIIAQVEMGQGTYTSLPMLIAEELEVPLSSVQIEHAPPNDKLYANPLLGFQATGGSTSIRGAWEPMRRAGATARTLLIAAAAQQWTVSPADCHAVAGYVVHPRTERKFAYGALVDKAARLKAPDHVELKPSKAFTLIGTPAKRLDAPDKVNGNAQYGIDVQLPGMKIASVATCPVIGGRLRSVDDSEASRINGVRQIVRLDNAVAVVADHTGAARKGLAALKITWDEGANAHFATQDYIKQLDEASKWPGVVATQVGDAEAAIAGAAQKLEAVYQVPFLAHATMEPMNCTVRITQDGCELWGASQVAVRAQAAAAQVLGIGQDKVKFHNHLLGGGFGRRLETDIITQAVQIAKQVNSPVKVIWSREEDTQHSTLRPYYYDRMAAGLDKNGMPVGWSHRVVGSSILARWLPKGFVNGLDRDAVVGAAGVYDFPALTVDYVRSEPPPGLTTAFWRGVGVTHNTFMVEGFVDEMAALAEADPVEYRRALLGKDPRARRVLERAAQKARWGQPLPPGTGLGIALAFGFGSYVAQVAQVTINMAGDLKVTRVVCVVDCGQNVNPDTIKAQMQGGAIFGMTAALYGQITFKDGRVEQGNFESYQMVRMNEAPAFDIEIVPSTEAPGGIGELGTTTIAPAIVNAIFAVTGKRLRELPIDPAQLGPAKAARGSAAT